MKKKVLHIYFGSSSTAGSYLYSIYSALKEDFDQKLVVDYDFPYESDTVRLGFRYTNLSITKIKNYLLRMILRLTELVVGMIRILFYVRYYKPDVINYSLNMNIRLEYWLLKGLKRVSKRAKIMITVHDSKPETNALRSSDKREDTRRRIFKTADFLLVHNDYSKGILLKNYKVPNHKIKHHLFPPMDTPSNVETDFKLERDIDYIFLGNLREEKGIDILIESWQKYNTFDEAKQLHIVGKWTISTILNEAEKLEKEKANIFIQDEYISDLEFTQLLYRSKYIVLPYTAGTNSGFPILAINCGCVPIVSDLTMFKEMPYLTGDCYFERSNVQSLCDKFLELKTKEIDAKVLLDNLLSYENEFANSVKEVYQTIE